MSSTPRRLAGLIGALVLALSASACGTRLSHAQIVRDAGAANTSGSSTGAQSADALAAGPAGDSGTAAGNDAAGAAAASNGPTGGSGSATGASSGTAAGGSTATASGQKAGSGPAAGAAGSGSGAAATGSGAAGQATGTPIPVGNVGEYSGVVGSSLSAGQPMVKIWAQWVNQHGGINGHPVQIYTADDGSDPSKARALTQQMIDQYHVVAFVGDMVPLTIAPIADYLDQRHVPLLGGDVSAPDWNAHPMVFPQGTGALALYDAGVYFDAKFIQQAGGNKWGAMYCAEDAACGLSYQHASAKAKDAGLDPVYGEQVSLTQPSYTAQCLNAKSKGVNILLVTLDANSVSRVARDCTAQGFKPLYASGSVIVTSELEKDTNLENMISIEPTFGWTFSGSPAAQEYQSAIKALNPGLHTSSAGSAAWVSGKLLQAALAKVPPSATVTAQDVINGLYALHDEALGGLAPPLNFAANQPAPQATCYFGVQIQHGHWVALNDGKAYC